jgi:pentatricopeptide repeat domain-containing protein 1
MMESSLIPDIQTYSSVISACEAAGQWQRALGILRSMSFENNEGPLPNLYCFNAAIAACEKGGAWVEALDLYERLRSSPGNVQPNFITLNSLLISLENAGQRELAASIYQDALRDGILSPWKYRLDFTGTRVSALDLHQFSAPLAKTAIRSVIESLLLHQAVHDIRKDLIIIVGKGNGSDRGKPILSPLVQKILLDEFDIASEIEEWNSGRVRIRAHSLAAFVQAKAFRA